MRRLTIRHRATGDNTKQLIEVVDLPIRMHEAMLHFHGWCPNSPRAFAHGPRWRSRSGSSCRSKTSNGCSHRHLHTRTWLHAGHHGHLHTWLHTGHHGNLHAWLHGHLTCLHHRYLHLTRRHTRHHRHLHTRLHTRNRRHLSAWRNIHPPESQQSRSWRHPRYLRRTRLVGIHSHSRR